MKDSENVSGLKLVLKTAVRKVTPYIFNFYGELLIKIHEFHQQLESFARSGMNFTTALQTQSADEVHLTQFKTPKRLLKKLYNKAIIPQELEPRILSES